MGQLTFPAAAKIYADTSVFSYTIEENSAYYTLLEPLWTKFYQGTIKIVSSELTLLEVLVMPLRDRNDALVETYQQLLWSSNIELVPITQVVLREAALLRATTPLKTPDAIHAATSFGCEGTIFLTNDSQFRNVPGLPVLLLSDVLAS